MSSVICPTVTAYEPHEYREQLERIVPFTKRIHIDVMDGELAPVKSVGIKHVYWPEDLVQADIHVMHQHPERILETLVTLRPSLVIIHAEADGNLLGLLNELRSVGIKAGVALLQTTSPADVRELIEAADHVLIFSGNLGYHGGTADLTLLKKVADIRQIKPSIEVGWDGGANMENVRQLAEGGIDVINVGGAVQSAPNPRDAYMSLQAQLNE